LALRSSDLHRSQENLAVASSRLVEQIRWNANERLIPAEPNIVPIELVDSGLDKNVLIATALQQRPEISESRQLIAEACERLRREQYAPLVPSVLLGMSYGGMGGGLGGDLNNYGDRLDADAVAFWEIRNLGLGERAARREASARIDQARARELAELDRVAREVVEAHAQVLARRKQIDAARDAISTAETSYAQNVKRIQNGQGLPIEVLQAIQALASARREYLRAVADYNVAQFTLQRALGWQIQS
jgi:outer membrane protein TolC